MKTALVTGASQGWGLEITKQLLKKEFSVIATYRSEISEELEKLTTQHKNSMRVFQMDVTDIQSVQKVAEKITSLDLLINNAGTFSQKMGQRFTEIPSETWQKIFETNFYGVVNTTRAFLPALQKTKAPQVVMVSSQLASLSANTGGGFHPYRVSKVAVNMLTQSLRAEFPHTDFRLVTPGHIKTRMGGDTATFDATESAVRLIKFLEQPKAGDTRLYHMFNGFIDW